MRSKIVALMAFMLLASMLPMFSMVSAVPEAIWVEPASNPPTATPYVGYTWNVTVWITSYNNPNVFAYQVKMYVDDTMLTITRAWRPNWDNRWIFFGLATVGTTPALYDIDIDGSNESALVGDSLLGGGETPPPEPAMLAVIELKIIRAPGKYENLSTPLNIANADTFVLDDTLASRDPIKTDGTYTWAWTPPTTNPDVAIRPEAKSFDQYHNWNGTVFTEEVHIENLEIAWALHNATLNITYNSPDNILKLVSVSIDSAWAGPNSVHYEEPGEIYIFVKGHPAPAGDVLVATISFNITNQQVNPPHGTPQTSDLILHDVTLMDTVGPITVDSLINGEVTLYAYLIIPLPWFEVQPDQVILGPDLVVGDQYGKEFVVNVNIKGLFGTWKMIGWNLRLTYDPTLMDIVSITEGSFLADPRWNRYGTLFVANPDDPSVFCPKYNIAMGACLFSSPDANWYRYPGLWNEEIVVENASKLIQPAHAISGLKWHEIAPPYMTPCTNYMQLGYNDKNADGLYSVDDKMQLNETTHGWIEWYTIKEVTYVGNGINLKIAQDPVLAEGTLATIRFKAIKQSWTTDYTFNLTIYPLFPPTNYLIDPYFNEIPVDEFKITGCVYTVKAIEAAGRRIDLWMINPPNGGQGLYQPADLVLPQTEVTLTAKVTYNWWPVQYKKVTFEIRDNHGVLWAILQSDTDDEGHAYVTFRMPWPCEGAEDLLGKWNITASVTLADVVIRDWMAFDYDYLVHIWKITTDKLEYQHCETAKITVSYGTKAMRTVNVVLTVTVTDELGVPFGIVLVDLTVGGASYCTYMNATTTVSIHIVKFAYAGLAIVHASFLSALPTQGGEAVAQEVTKTFYILPL